MVDEAMEQIIEFPIEQGDIFTEQPLLPRGYCLCYQYNVDQHGYGPYGFNTATATNFLRTLFPDLLHWEPERQILESLPVPTQEGVYFSKTQPHTLALKEELEDYQKKIKIESLREKYKKNDTPTAQIIKPTLINLTEHQKIPAQIISTFITHEHFFLINYFFMSNARNTLIFFNKNIPATAKKIAESMNLRYLTLDSMNELKPW